MLKLLLCLPTELVEALMDGTLGVKMMQKTWYDKHFYRPKDAPKIYVNVVLVQRGRNKATWLTANETKRLIIIPNNYNRCNKNDQDAVTIGKIFRPTPSIWNIADTEVGWRRWIDAKPDRTNKATLALRTGSNSIQQFVNSLQKNHIDPVPDDKHDVPQVSVLIEISKRHIGIHK
jgi:hypothetical protein